MGYVRMGVGMKMRWELGCEMSIGIKTKEQSAEYWEEMGCE